MCNTTLCLSVKGGQKPWRLLHGNFIIDCCCNPTPSLMQRVRYSRSSSSSNSSSHIRTKHSVATRSIYLLSFIALGMWEGWEWGEGDGGEGRSENRGCVNVLYRVRGIISMVWLEKSSRLYNARARRRKPFCDCIIMCKSSLLRFD